MVGGLPGFLDGEARGTGSLRGRWCRIKVEKAYLTMNDPPIDSEAKKLASTLLVRRRINATREKLFAAWSHGAAQMDIPDRSPHQFPAVLCRAQARRHAGIAGKPSTHHGA